MRIKVLNDDEWALVQQYRASKKAGTISTTVKSGNTSLLMSLLEQEFPGVISGIRQGIVDVNAKDISGGDKAVRVALDVLSTAPAILQAVPGIKHGLVAVVTKLFAEEISDFGATVLENVLRLK